MFGKGIVSTLFIAALAAVPAQRATADAGDAVAGAIVGGIIGHAIGSQQQKKKVYVQRKTVYKTAKPSISSAQRAENRSVQSALNYFGFNAGSADGVLGRNSRAAISNYQAHMGYSPTGQLTQYERDFLLTSHNRALAGGPATAQQIAANPMGPRGLLIAYRDQLAGGGAAPVATMPATAAVVAPPAAVTEAAAPVENAPVMPSFAAAGTQQSLASHCNAINLLTNTNGGFSTLANWSDPKTVLNEQFCLARTYAIANTEQMVSRVQGFTPDQIAEQCRALAPLLKDQVAGLSLKPRDEVKKDVAGFILQAGMSPAQMSETAKICLGTGYRTDEMDVALGSALLLVALGEPVYSELLGHHLSQGFGTSKRPDLSLAWYDEGANALEGGATPVFAPGQPERAQLIRAAATGADGTAAPGVGPAPVPASAAMPSFNMAE
ncbi:peptidoglycan-binding domain-containing protein [Tropicimonas sp.]|uniref:peptidoglycan-binding domain-containing protein n=1 Tax=Tropicimonas sp. TaxID=2067044 RepID=UPI003A83ED66